ncbi:hypothetical protein IFM89_027225 [Coptis chinensis]|uniref:AAA+ ATPase domain-containing protein n=1 Tax=Coptis chinensis TaxID=261450 RepID=A0A835HHD8_9MAGN|nr:hypothetical protein IFM89_027225 [Coptis chinensis]
MDPVSGIAGVTAPVLAHGERELSYIIHFRRNIKNLGDNINALEANRRDVRSLVDAARNNNHSIRKTVDTWLEQADRLFKEATQLKSEAGDINSRRKGWVSGSRFSLGKKAAKKNVDIQKHLGEGSKFGENNVSDPMPVQSYEPEPVGDFKTFSSREATKSEVIAALRADKNSLVGIYGMPGVGKTMLMKAVMAQLKKEKVFDEVVMVVVSQKPDLEKIQDAIAEKLDLKFTGNLRSTRAAQLRQRLNQERKTTLLCLDDVWKCMELDDVGIPYKNVGNRCKVIFTTRIQGVCESMERDEKIEVKVLSEEDSWNLFRSKADGVVDLFKTVAGNIVKECKGLPLAIVTLGLALRNKDVIAVWEDTLARLQKSISEKMKPVNASIRLSYDFLQDETAKMCFLFCCMFPEDFQIPTDVLFGYMMGEKLIRDVDTFEEARNRLQVRVEELTSAGLLLKKGDGRIMMHDAVRDVAVSIACEERNEFIVKAKMSFDEWPDMELEKCKRLSLMDTKIRYHPLPSQIKAPNLLTLSLNSFNDLNEIPSNFFQEMTNLLTLDLSNTNIRSLPASLSSLTNLRTLHVNKCDNLTNISPVEKLNSLEILCLNESGIKKFPEEMGSLTSLKSLNFLRTYPPYITISPKVIARLSRLKDFSGNYIENLEFSSENDASPWKKMTRFRISLGEDHILSLRYLEEMEFQRSLFLTLSSISVSHLIQVLLPETMFLYLKCKRIENVLQLYKIEVSFPNLRELVVEMCGKLVTLIPSTRLCYLPPSIFHNLTDLSISNCDKLKHLFPLRVFQRLSKLEKMCVMRCSTLEILFPDDSDIESGDVEKDKASHPHMKDFSLFHLPELSSFSGSDSLVVDWPSAKSLQVNECPNLKRLPLGTHSVPKLENFAISDQEWFDKLEWYDQRIQAKLQTLLEVKC